VADIAQLERALRAADAAGDTEGATVLARELSRVRQSSGSGGIVDGFKEYIKDPIGNTTRTLADLGLGMYRGFKNVTDAGLQAGYHAVGQGDRADQVIRDQKAQYDAATKGRIFAPVGEVIGNVAATLPIAPGAAATGMGRVAQAGGLGALTGAAQPVYEGDNFLAEKAKQAGIGGLAGAAGGTITEGISRVLAPRTAPQVRTLLDEGVELTPGQILGGKYQRAEQGLGSIPVAGDVVRGAERRSINSLNTAAYNRALNPIGQNATGIKPGREGIDQVQQRLSAAYDDLLPKLKIAPDGQFWQEIQTIRDAVDLLPEAKQGQFAKMVQSQFDKFGKASAAPGVTMKHVDSQLAAFARKFSDNTDGDNRMLAEALDGVRTAMRGMVERSNAADPQLSAQLAKINEGYANFVRLQRAAAATGADTGVFTGAQLASAVRGMDTSARKGRFARGDALLQDLSDAAKSVMSQKVPDSGTPYRTLLALGGAGAIEPSAALLGGAAMLPYTAPGQRIAASLLTQRPAALREAGELAGLLSPGVGALSGQLSSLLLPRQ
jgi:hypothetical protein